MIKTIAIALVIGIMAISLPLYAEDGNNVADELGDIFSGKGNGYIGAEVIKDNIIGNWGLKGWFDVLAGEIDTDVRRDIRGGLRVRLVL